MTETSFPPSLMVISISPRPWRVGMAMVKGKNSSALEIFMMEIECADREELG